METLRFLNSEQVRSIRDQFGTPCYVYDENALRRQADAALRFPHAFGLTVRYAMKASSNATILRIFDRMGLHVDASSGYEAWRAIRAGVTAQRISLSTQEMPEDFASLHEQGIAFNACSLRQLERFGQLFPGETLGLRFNPGMGSGSTKKTNVGGPASSFGIWKEQAGEAREIAAKYGLKIRRIHTHIGSGSDPEVWQRVAMLNLAMVREFPEVTVLNMGGGFKVGRMTGEKSTDLQTVGAPVKAAFEAFARETGRELHLELEPGTFLLANSGCIVATIQDVVETGDEGYRFLKLDAGMTEILRPSLYASQHPLVTIPQHPTGRSAEYIVVGHCCESGDLITPAPGDTELLATRQMEEAQPGDLCVIEGAGAYCASMASKNYNSFPEAPEALLRADGQILLIRRRQTLGQIVQNEVNIPL
jgi:diaminopimelate decarboxylase